ncbi:MAG: DUF3344 domain-containing protein [Acidimicrobiales bacterium]
MKSLRRALGPAVAGFLLLLGAAAPVQATNSDGPPLGATDGVSAEGITTQAVPNRAYTARIRGGYTSAGTTLRNAGAGSITIDGIPEGARVRKAYLYWSILDDSEDVSFRRGRLNNRPITGRKVGQGVGPCWGTEFGYAYRADVTSKVRKNGTYDLTSFASGTTDGTDPWVDGVAPFAEGASLVVIYTKNTMPLTRIVVNDGYEETRDGNTLAMNIPYSGSVASLAGEVKTTFVVADGQNSSEPGATFNGTPLPAVDLDGTDGPTPGYSNGNLWDTETVSVGNLVNPGDTSADLTLTGDSDCLVWVAQVLSIGLNGTLDTDKDKLLDGWEANGYDADGNGTIDVDLPALGASVNHKDLFIEMDWMDTPDTYMAAEADLDRIVEVYANAPIQNPDGIDGIKLHLDAGSARSDKYNLGGGNQVPLDTDLNPLLPQFNAIKANHFDAVRAKIFYYMIWADSYNNTSSSGNAMSIPGDQFVVTLGRWNANGTPDQRVGTFIHEFGHDLGLEHGGDEGKNYKPNYLSVMSYAFQTVGVPMADGSPSYFGYSSFKAPNLIESRLRERSGLRSRFAAPFDTRWYCPAGALTTGTGGAQRNVDWTCDGTFDARAVSVDINKDGALGTLKGHDDWKNLVFGGGAVGGAGIDAASVAAPLDELTFEEASSQG